MVTVSRYVWYLLKMLLLFICRIPSFVTVQTQLKMVVFVYLSYSFICYRSNTAQNVGFCLFVVFLHLLHFKHNSKWVLFIRRIPSRVTVQTQLKIVVFVYLSHSFIATVQTQHATVAKPTLFQHF